MSDILQEKKMVQRRADANGEEKDTSTPLFLEASPGADSLGQVFEDRSGVLHTDTGIGDTDAVFERSLAVHGGFLGAWGGLVPLAAASG